MRIVLLGAPGSGKRTQTKLMVDKYGIPPIYTGELIKAALSEDSPLGQQVRDAVEAGHSVTEEIVLELIQQRLQLPDAQDGFILDGFPRNILQAITLDEQLAELGKPVELALLIEIETDVLMERLVGRRTCSSCGTQYNIYNKPTAVDGVCDLCGGRLRHRADDNEETISSRLHVYDHLAAALIKHYSKQEKIQRVDGAGEIEEVFKRICSVVDSHESPSLGEDQAQPVVKIMETPEPEVAGESVTSEPQAKASRASAKRTKTAKKRPAKKKVVKKARAKQAVASKKKKTSTKKALAKKVIASKKKTSAKKALAKKVIASKKKKTVAKKKAAQKTPAKKKATKKPLIKKKTSQKKPGSKKKGSTPKAVSMKKQAKKGVIRRTSSKKATGKAKVQPRGLAKKAAVKKKSSLKKKPVKKAKVRKKAARKKS